MINFLLILGSIIVLISPHWCEGSYTDDTGRQHCLFYGPYEQCFTATCIGKFAIADTKKSIDLFDSGCIKINIHDIETAEPKDGHIIHCTEIFVGINIGLLLLSGICYLIDINKDLVIFKLITGIFTSVGGCLMLISLPLFVLTTDVVYTKIPTDADTSAIVMKTEMGVSVSIGVGVGLMTLAVGIYNIVRGRRIFRKKTAQQKLGFAFGSGL